MKDSLQLFNEAKNKFTNDILDAFFEVQQSRSNFQIENFVIGQHDTEEMQYVQCILELQNLYYTIKTVSLELQKKEIEIKRLRSTGDEIDEIDAQIKEVGLEQTRIVGIGAFRELEKLLEIYNSFPVKFTRNQIEEGQEKYWQKRLTRQASLEAIGGSQAQAAHLDSLKQIGLLNIDYENNIVSSIKMLEQNDKIEEGGE